MCHAYKNRTNDWLKTNDDIQIWSNIDEERRWKKVPTPTGRKYVGEVGIAYNDLANPGVKGKVTAIRQG